MYKALALVGMFLVIYSLSFSQKPVIDSSLSMQSFSWPSVNRPVISDDGHFFMYCIENSPPGSHTLIVESTDKSWKKQYESYNGEEFGKISISNDSKFALFKNVGDSLGIISLGKDKEQWIPNVASFDLVKKGNVDWLIYQSKSKLDSLVIRTLQTGEQRYYLNVSAFVFNNQHTDIVLKTLVGVDIASFRNELVWIDLNNNKVKTILNSKEIYTFVFDGSGRNLAITGTPCKSEKQGEFNLMYYHLGSDSAIFLTGDKLTAIDTNFLMPRNGPFFFSKDGDAIFFNLVKKEKPIIVQNGEGPKVNVWDSKLPNLASEESIPGLEDGERLAVVNIKERRIVQLQKKMERIVMREGELGDFVIAYSFPGIDRKLFSDDFSSIFCVSIKDGSRRVIKDHLRYQPHSPEFVISPSGNWVIYFDREAKAWFSYNLENGKSRNITHQLPHPVFYEDGYEYPHVPITNFLIPVGVAGWIKDNAVLIYDDYDIWKVNLYDAESPVCLTKRYGRKNSLKFRIIDTDVSEIPNQTVSLDSTLMLSAYDPLTKFNGFYKLDFRGTGIPAKLFMGPYILYINQHQISRYSKGGNSFLLKAKEANLWVLNRRCAVEAPNFFFTDDFRKFNALSEIQPQNKFNWLTTELLHWKEPDGTPLAGILYKPENFDSTKKYPVIFYYYEHLSDNLNDYPIPSLCADAIDIPHFVSRGYLIFVPDIHYTIGYPGLSAEKSIVSAANYLSKFSFIDKVHMGLQGVSFGGFETNYLITHSNLFAAAVEGFGPADIISGYGSLMYGYGGEGASAQFYYEYGQGRIGATLWQRPDLYIENSPILLADRVSTPLLMMHNKEDALVPFSQAIEFFTALRRLGKHVWLLQYDEAGHGIGRFEDKRDYTRRMLQFFDYYLKGFPPPKWMTTSMPASTRRIDLGYELDRSGKLP